ncbi:hypothetical protein HUW62_22975 [Myxococcus sp. AM011]|uniref:hypothetical protein n=1 Tax=Myxococcus sp. AM011 TaxID=2745200 RepID=UPI0015958EE2|nr:hypothetical protein [Myxococcus sp. AM011]NVJ24095.1 hypothetical protein [Myxococcus sp. AM011]
MNSPIDILRSPSLSTYREQLVEYVFLSELLQDGWLRRRQRIDVLRADVDAAGYDLVLECGGVLRHVQLKSSVEGGSTREQKVHIDLAAHTCGCVVWVIIEERADQRIRLRFRVMGGGPRQPLPDLSEFLVATHTKSNAEGVKTERPSIRVIPQRYFTELATTTALSDWLFGVPPK